MEIDFERCYRSVSSRDSRFDGWFVTAVTSTGIYCRPSCPALTPRRENVRFHATAAAAQREGYRACKRCRPDATPGSPEWNLRADVVGRAMRLIADGVVDRDGVDGLAARLGYTARHLRRLLTDEVGAGPLALARAQRAQSARTLVETTDLSFAHIAFAAGFSSVRQFNDTVQAVFATTPGALRRHAQHRDGRARRRPGAPAANGNATTISLRLAHRRPCDIRASIDFLAARAVPGIEEVDGPTYRRSLRLPRGTGTVSLTPEDDHVRCVLDLEDLRDLQAAVERCRRLLDLDADPDAVVEHLGADDLLGTLVRRRPGLRLVCSPDGIEAAVRVLVGQQVAVAGATTLTRRLVETHGSHLKHPRGKVTRLFPTAGHLAGVDPALLPLPQRRARALRELCALIADGDLVPDPGTDRDGLAVRMLAIPGVGPWTVDLVRLRALGDTDVLPAQDLGVRRAIAALGSPADRADFTKLSLRWRPWRSYVLHHLWAEPHRAAAAAPTPPTPPTPPTTPTTPTTGDAPS